jgi:hypothetical protein
VASNCRAHAFARPRWHSIWLGCLAIDATRLPTSLRVPVPNPSTSREGRGDQGGSWTSQGELVRRHDGADRATAGPGSAWNGHPRCRSGRAQEIG